MTNRLHVSGYRFLVRRMEHALVRGDVRMLDDPLRAQSLSLIAGCVLTAVIVGACAVLAFLRPQGALGNAPIMMVRESGALYVRIGDTVHPVLNLASARLVAGTAANPVAVAQSAIDAARRGPSVGIPGAPATIATPLGEEESTWTVCDDATRTIVAAGDVLRDGLSSGRSALATPHAESAATTYLLYDGWRAEVDLRNRAVVRALRLDGVVPRPVSRALLDAIPEAPPIAAPHIPEAGSAGPPPLRGFAVGSVVRVVRTDAVEHYVVLSDGVQRVGEVAADLIRFTDSQRGREIATVAPDVVGAVPVVDPLPVATFPERGGVSAEPVLCAQWRPSGITANSTVLMGNSLPRDGMSVPLAQADGDGPNVDEVVFPHGRSAYVRSTGVTGEGDTTAALYYINDLGVIFGIHDGDAAHHLGLAGPAVRAPWPVLARLPRGPELSKEAASIARDSVAGPS
ncbi:type VII secretion protein EccB [Mycobacterium sp. MMS18-G62]